MMADPVVAPNRYPRPPSRNVFFATGFIQRSKV